ncbi:uncharacterized protein LOC128728604 [Anopheles nili]|uniref:uncharacterized protein LOC128728604 n=1 Tax=Anopheles nili TaxID=185578 RepID=UPI00237C1A0B|nr:uncharacterized protein LOC128728604 [Anopheles nili]
MAAIVTLRVGVLFALVGFLLAVPPEISPGGGNVPATRRFHAKFVIDRIEPRRPPPSTDDQSTAGPLPVPTGRTRSTTRCREGCLQKRSIKDILCTQQRECSMCWDVCNRNHQIRKENELAHRLLLSLVRLIRNESVVTADIEWTTPLKLVQHQPHPVVPSPLAASENVEQLSRIARDGAAARDGLSPSSRLLKTLAGKQEDVLQQDAPGEELLRPASQEYHQCLVSWEISGGGLTGNLLTETSKVELSLWPNTKYHVRVTCRNKETDLLIRSPSLLVDTGEAVIVSLQNTTTTTSSTTTTTESTPPGPVNGAAINSAIQDVISNRLDNVDGQASPVTNEDDELQEFTEQQPRHHRHHSFWPFDRGCSDLAGTSTGGSKEILILGAFVALLALVLLALTVVILVRRKPGPLEDQELLIESEILPKILHV